MAMVNINDKLVNHYHYRYGYHHPTIIIIITIIIINLWKVSVVLPLRSNLATSKTRSF
jgi:hypothetical protein